MIKKIINILTRSITLVSRFLFIFFVAKYLDAPSFGYYSIFTATIGYFTYIVGLDFYTFSNREIIKANDSLKGGVIRNQASLSILLYLVVLPFAALFLSQTTWPDHLVWWFVPILILEHINQEIFRLLVAQSEQLAASVLLFIRQASWAIAIVILMAWAPEARNLDTVMALWTCAGFIAAILGIFKISRMDIGGWRLPVDWKWIRQGVIVCSALLLGTLALRGIQTADRYWLEYLAGIEAVGAYALFLGVASTLLVFLDAGIFSYAYPDLIKLAHENKGADFRLRVKHMAYQTVAASFAFAIVSWFLVQVLLEWIGNPIYRQTLYLFPWVLAAMVANAIGMVTHYALYARGHDRTIIFSHIAAIPVFIISTWVISFTDRVLAVPIGLCSAFIAIFVWKTIAYFRLENLERASNSA